MDAFKDQVLAGKVAFVAGGSSGINLGIAEYFSHHGAKVALLSRSQDKLDAAVAGIQAAGGEALGIAADVRDYAAVEAALAQVQQRWGNLDVVISGAAGNFVAAAKEMSANAFKTVVDIDLLGTFNVFRGAHELLNPGASLIAITAGQAEQAMAMQAHACAAKAGINQLVRTLAIDWGQTRHIAKNPERFYEKNRILGASPSVGKVDAYFLGAMVGTVAVAHLLPTDYRRLFLAGTLSMELSVVEQNRSIGIKVEF